MTWIQYRLSDGQQLASVPNKTVTQDDLDKWAIDGINQIECPADIPDPTIYNIDVTQTPHVLILNNDSLRQ